MCYWCLAIFSDSKSLPKSPHNWVWENWLRLVPVPWKPAVFSWCPSFLLNSCPPLTESPIPHDACPRSFSASTISVWMFIYVCGCLCVGVKKNIEANLASPQSLYLVVDVASSVLWVIYLVWYYFRHLLISSIVFTVKNSS